MRQSPARSKNKTAAVALIEAEASTEAAESEEAPNEARAKNAARNKAGDKDLAITLAEEVARKSTEAEYLDRTEIKLAMMLELRK